MPPTRITPIKLEDRYLYLLDRIAEVEHISGRADTIRFAINEAAKIRGLHDAFVMWKTYEGDPYPVPVMVPRSPAEARLLEDFLAREFARWPQSYLTVSILSRKDDDPQGWYSIALKNPVIEESIPIIDLLSGPTISGRTCVMDIEGSPTLYYEVPLQPGVEWRIEGTGRDCPPAGVFNWDEASRL